MADFREYLTEWKASQDAFIAAFTEVRPKAEAVGLVLDRPNAEIEGHPFVLHAEFRASGGLVALSSLDFALRRDGGGLRQSRPGGSYQTDAFHVADTAYFLGELRRLLEAAKAQQGVG